MIDARRPMGVLVRDRVREQQPARAQSRSHGFPARVVALALAVAIFVTLGGSTHPIDLGNTIVLQERASALQERWSQMVTDGVPATDLTALHSEWLASQHPQLFGIALKYLLPDMKSVVDRWQAEGDAIWARALNAARASAAAAEMNLHQALDSEPFDRRKERLEELRSASTPAELRQLQAAWELQTRLVPIDKAVATAVGRLTTLSAQARGLRIKTDPVPALLTRAKTYSSLADTDRFAQSELLLRDLAGAEQDLKARVAAATLAKQAFKRAADEISVAGLYGVSVAAAQAKVDQGSRSYAAATHAAQFDTIRKDLDAAVADLKRAVNVVLSQVHVISGVAFYNQTHALSCEEAAVSMALTHQGIHLSQDQILAEMGADRRPMYVDSAGRVRWGDPYISFVGNVDGSERNYTGSQANYPPLVRVAQAHGARIIAYGYMTAQTIYARVAAGHPVVAWATWDWAWHPRHDYLSFGGRWIPWIGPTYESHVYLVLGVRPGSVLVNDPIRGQYWVAKATFQAAYSDFMEAIVFA